MPRSAIARRVTRPPLATSLILVMAGLMASCAPASPAASATSPALASTATPGAAATPGTTAAASLPVAPGVITLVTPAAGAVITQNDPSLKTSCPASATRGLGYVIEFGWTIPAGLANLDHFQVVLQHGASTPIALDVDGATTTSYTELACNTFIIDTNLTGWHWQVKAVDSARKVLATSEQRGLTFGPCRLSNASPCNAAV